MTLGADANEQPHEAPRRRPETLLRTLLRRVFVACIATLLCMPLAAMLYPRSFDLVASIDEHREPAPFPPLRALRAANGDFAAKANRWFDDRVGLRDLLIRTKNQIDYSIFHTSRKVYVGRDGWLFEHGTTDARLAFERADAGELRKVEYAFLDLAQRLHRAGVRLIVVGYPDKSMVYPDMLPPQAPHIPRGGNYDRLRAFLAAQPELNFIDAEDILEREKSQTTEPLLYKTDIHVSITGSIPIVRSIVERIAALEGRPEIRWDEKFEVRHGHWSGGSEGRFLSLLWPVSERAAYIAPAHEIGRDEADGHWNIPDRRVIGQVGSGAARPFDFEFRSLPELCPQRLPGLALFGDSFSDRFWALGLQRYFCFVRRSRTPIERLTPFVASIPQGTRYFIFQYVAAYLPGVAPWLKPE